MFPRFRVNPCHLLLTLVAGLLASATTAKAQHPGATAGMPGKAPTASINFGGSGGPREAPHRTIVGHVLGKNGKPLSDAMVYLKDDRTSEVRTLLVGEDGSYRFGPLPLTNDYSIWAEDKGMRTRVRAVSSLMETQYVSFSLAFDESATPIPPVSKSASAAKPAGTVTR